MARRPRGGADTVKHRIARRLHREAVRCVGAFQRQIAALWLQIGNRHLTATMRQFKRLRTWHRERALIGGGLAVIIFQRVALAHVLSLQVVDQNGKERPKNPQAERCQIEISKEWINHCILRFAPFGGASYWEVRKPDLAVVFRVIGPAS